MKDWLHDKSCNFPDKKLYFKLVMHIHSCYIVVFIVNSEYSVQPSPNKDLQETITVPGI